MLKSGGEKGNILRNLAVSAQRNDLQKWKDSSNLQTKEDVEAVILYKNNVGRVYIVC